MSYLMVGISFINRGKINDDDLIKTPNQEGDSLFFA